MEDFLDWHLDLGVDLILALDGGSTDGTRAVLERYARTKRVVWFALPERNMTKYSIADELPAMARDRYEADWIIYCDVDEFVCTHGKSLRTVLAECDRDGITLLNLPRRTMTGPLIPPGRRATEVLTLRIDRTVVPTTEQTDFLGFPGALCVPGSWWTCRSSRGCHPFVRQRDACRDRHLGHERHERSVHPALRHPWIRGIAAEGAQHREVARGQPASSARDGAGTGEDGFSWRKPDACGRTTNASSSRQSVRTSWLRMAPARSTRPLPRGSPTGRRARLRAPVNGQAGSSRSFEP